MKIIQKMALIISVPLLTLAKGGDVVNNGGGLGEKNVIFSFLNLAQYISPCLTQKNVCQLTEKEYSVLEEIFRGVEVKNQKGGVYFKSEKLNPGFFEVDDHGQTRIAVTSSNPGDPIYFNIDQMYTTINTEVKTLSVLDAVSILIHEIGHHYSIKDHLFLDRLGSKVQSYRQKYTETINLAKYNQQKFAIKAYNIGTNIYDYFYSRDDVFESRLIFENGFEILDITTDVQKKILCPKYFKLIAVHFSNMYWLKIPLFDQTTHTQSISAMVDVDYRCESELAGSLDNLKNVAQIEIQFKLEVMETSFDKTNLVKSSSNGKDWQSLSYLILTPQQNLITIVVQK